MKNLFDFKADAAQELFDTIHEGGNIRIERIVSMGQASPEGFWYDQEENEWVCLLDGSAVLEYEDGKKEILNKGDYLFIPAHKKHRVKSTDTHMPTIWLAVFYR